MTFAEELRNAVTRIPAQPLPMPAEDAGEAAWLNWHHSLLPQPRETAVRVYEVTEGFPGLMSVCYQKDLFSRPVWAQMGLSGTPEQQMWDFIRRKVQDYTQAALWTQGTYWRLLVRVDSQTVHSALSVGQGMTEENRLEMYRALWDCGIREINNHVREETPHLQRMRALGHFTFEPVEKKPGLLLGRLRFSETRP